MRTRAIAAVGTIVVVLLAVLFVVQRRSVRGTINIGVVLPLTGSMAEYGQNGRDGITLASEEIATQHGVRSALRLIYQDSKDAPQETVNAVHRLVDVDSVSFVIGGLTSSGVLAAAPYAQQRGVLFFTPAASAPGIPEIGDLVFRNWPSDDALATQFGDAAFRRLGVRSIAILHVSNAYGTTNAGAFAKAFRAAGGTVELTRAFPQGTTDFRTLITEVSNVRGLGKVLVIAYPDEYRGFFQALARSRVPRGSVLASDTFYSPALVGELGEVAEGTIFGVAAKPDSGYAPRQRFINEFRSRFNRDPGLVSDNAYDALHLIATAIYSTDGTPRAVARWLSSVKDYQGAVGPLTFTASRDVPATLALFEVRGRAILAR